MTLEYISAQLKEESQRFNRETLSMGPYDTANFLLLCGEILLKYIEYSNKQIEPEQSEFYRIPSHTKSLTDEQVEDVVNLIEKMEEDEDVLNVFHNMDMN